MNEGLIKLREYIRKDKPKVLRQDFKQKQPLTWGWMLPYLMGLDGYLYAPWMVKAFDFLDTYNEQGEATPHLQQQSLPTPLLPPATTAEVKGQMEWALA